MVTGVIYHASVLVAFNVLIDGLSVYNHDFLVFKIPTFDPFSWIELDSNNNIIKKNCSMDEGCPQAYLSLYKKRNGGGLIFAKKGGGGRK